MSNFNILYVELDCPRCGERVTACSEIKFGYLDVITYRIGDEIEWWSGGDLTARRPTNGSLDGEAYAECPSCDKTFWLTVHVRHDKFEGAEVDHSRKGYDP